MSTLDQAMNYLADHSGIDVNSVGAPSQFSSGRVYLVRDHTTKTVMGNGFINKSSNISASEVLFTLPVGYRPKTTCSGSGFFRTATDFGAYYVNINANGNITQPFTGQGRSIFFAFEFEYA